MDGTFKTNIQGLVLVGVGGVYLVAEGNTVHNRWVLLMCALCASEDGLAYETVLRALIHVAKERKDMDLAPMVLDVYVDGHGGAAGAIATVLPGARLHRDLQHIKRNLVENRGKLQNRTAFFLS